MFVRRINLYNYRNHKSKEFEFNPGINVITGENTSGKTSIVEAIYYLSLARSFRGVDDDELILDECDYAEIDAEVVEGKIKRNIHILITKKGRSVLVNGKKVSKLSELTKIVNVLLFEPKENVLPALYELPIVLKVFPTDANFVLVRVTDANSIYHYLIEKGIVVRNRTRVQLCKDCLRITIGTRQENNELLGALRFYK